MIHQILKAIRSLSRLLWIVLIQTIRIIAALARFDFELAGGYSRILYLTVHEDLLSAVVAVQDRLGKRRQPTASIDRVLIVKLDRIGDMVTTTPVLDALRELYPRVRLDIVGHPLSLSILEGDDRINERFEYSSWLYQAQQVSLPGPRSWLLIFKLMLRRYPLVVYLRGSAPFLLLSLNSRLAATKYIFAEPVIDRYLNAIRKVCGPVRDYPPRLAVRSDHAAFALELLRADGRADWHAGPIIAIHASASSAVKMWPPDRFAVLADQLQRRFDARVHFLGGPADRTVLEAIAGLAEQQHYYHCTLRLPQSVAVIAEADIFIGNDSGLAHIAAAVGTRAVVLWGPANLSMARPKAAVEDCLILYHDLPCRDHCLEFRCHNPNQLACLTRTQVEDVVKAVSRLLGKEDKAMIDLPLAPAEVS